MNTFLKHAIGLALLLILASTLPTVAQELPKPREVDKDQRKQYRQTLRDVKQDYQQAKEEEWDIVLPPAEQVPTEIIEAGEMRAAGFTNWGRNLLLPDHLRSRVRAECKYRVILRIGDTGMDYDHPDLQKGKLPGKNYTTDPDRPDKNGHSTHVAGIAAGDEGGIASDLVDLGLLTYQPLQVLRADGRGSFGSVAQSIADNLAADRALIKNGTGVAYNWSLGGGTSLVGIVEAELKKSAEAGVIHVSASGNSGGEVNYPGASPYTIATGALQQNLQIANFSSRGATLFGAMPGVGILAPWKNGGYGSLSGTSMASPFEAGAILIALSKWSVEKLPDVNAVRAYLSGVKQDLGAPGRDNIYGWGVTYISAILDTEPGNGGGDPDPDPDPDPNPVFPDRVVSITSPNPGTIAYQVAQKPLADRIGDVSYTFQLGLALSGSTSEGGPFSSRDFPDVARLTEFPVLILEFKALADVEYNQAWTASNILAQKFFRNRGFGLAAPSDDYEATKWAAYFFELINERFEKVPVRVTRIVAKGTGGAIIDLSGDELLHWRGAPNW